MEKIRVIKSHCDQVMFRNERGHYDGKMANKTKNIAKEKDEIRWGRCVQILQCLERQPIFDSSDSVVVSVSSSMKNFQSIGNG